MGVYGDYLKVSLEFGATLYDDLSSDLGAFPETGKDGAILKDEVSPSGTQCFQGAVWVSDHPSQGHGFKAIG